MKIIGFKVNCVKSIYINDAFKVFRKLWWSEYIHCLAEKIVVSYTKCGHQKLDSHKTHLFSFRTVCFQSWVNNKTHMIDAILSSPISAKSGRQNFLTLAYAIYHFLLVPNVGVKTWRKKYMDSFETHLIDGIWWYLNSAKYGRQNFEKDSNRSTYNPFEIFSFLVFGRSYINRLSFLVSQILYFHLLLAPNVGVKTWCKNWSLILKARYVTSPFDFWRPHSALIRDGDKIAEKQIQNLFQYITFADLLLAPNVGVKSLRKK